MLIRSHDYLEMSLAEFAKVNFPAILYLRSEGYPFDLIQKELGASASQFTADDLKAQFETIHGGAPDVLASSLEAKARAWRQRSHEAKSRDEATAEGIITSFDEVAVEFEEQAQIERRRAQAGAPETRNTSMNNGAAPSDKAASGNQSEFHKANLVLAFLKNRDGSPREKPHYWQPKDGQIVIPNYGDEQGKLAYLIVSRTEAEDIILYMNRGQLTLADTGTKTQVVVTPDELAVVCTKDGQYDILFHLPHGGDHAAR